MEIKKYILIITISLGFLALEGCYNPKDAVFSLMSNIKTHSAIYRTSDGTLDTLSMGFKFYKPLLDFGSFKQFRILTKEVDRATRKYLLRNIELDTSAWMERVELLKSNTSSEIILTEHTGKSKVYEIHGKNILVYKQTYNKDKNPKNNYCEFFTESHGLIISKDRFSFRKLINYKGTNLEYSLSGIYSAIESDTFFFSVDTTSLFEVWKEVH